MSGSNLGASTESIIEVLMNNPDKRALVLQLLAQENPLFRELKDKLLLGGDLTPTKKLPKRNHHESPTALLRRRQLEKRDSSSDASSETGSESAESRGSGPFDQLLVGVIAYVEIKSNGNDRSDGAKGLMRTMGATVRDVFTNDVTHVVFKDGSFTTYQKAKLMKIHLVSVLWLEAVRRNNMRVSEKNYPALGTESYDEENVSTLCSQMQKDYEQVIREEVRRSLASGTPLPSTKSLANKRRRTLMPALTSSESFHTASGDVVETQRAPLPRQTTWTMPYHLDDINSLVPDLTSDNDSDCGIVNGYVSKRSTSEKTTSNNSESLISERKLPRLSDMDLTANVHNDSVVIISDSDNSSNILKNSPASRKSSLSTYMGPSEASMSLQMSLSTNENMSKNLNRQSAEVHHQPGTSKSSENEEKENLTVQSMSMLLISSTNSYEKSAGVVLTETTSLINRNVSTRNSGRHQSSIISESTKSFKKMSTNASTISYNNTGDGSSSSTVSNLTGKSPSPPKKLKSNSKPLNRTNSDVISTSSEINTDAVVIESSLKNNSQIVTPGSVRRQRQSSRISELTKSIPKTAPKDKLPANASTLSYQSNDNDYDADSSRDSSIRSSKLLSPDKNPVSSSSRNPIKTTKNLVTRKLYDPDDSIDNRLMPVSDEDERNEHRANIKKNTPPNNDDHCFLKPAQVTLTPLIVTSSAKELLDKKRSMSCPAKKQNKDPIVRKQQNKTTKEIERRPSFDSDNDEQKELAEELRRSNRKKSEVAPSPIVSNKCRRSARISLFKNNSTSCSSTSEQDDNDPVVPMLNRRSTLEFQSSTSQAATKQCKLRIDRAKQPSIVCTKMHKTDVQVFMQIVKKLGGFNIEDEVSKKTTHLVAGESKRTINMLRGIARGCWILRHDWVLRSLEADKWLPEEDFEVTDFSPAVQQCRLQRQAFGPLYSMDIFAQCGYIYVAKSSEPRCSDLRELIALCKGKVTTVLRNASIVVGEKVKQDAAGGITCVTEMWILDSITFNVKKPFKKYLINS